MTAEDTSAHATAHTPNRPAQSLSGGAAGIALLHLERAVTSTGSWPQAHAWLERSARDGLSVADNASLYYGAPALAFVLHSCARRPGLAGALATADAGTQTVLRRKLDAAHRRIDAGARPLAAEFDLISGLTGLGVCVRRRGRPDLLRQILTYLVRLTEPIQGLPGWWTHHSDHGMAHGITGPLALCALALHDGVEVDGQTAAIRRICAWLDTWEQRGASGAWWPATVSAADVNRGDTHQDGPLRPSWCYGTPGISFAQTLAARAVGDRAHQRRAERALANCVSDPAQLARLTDRSLCHGTAGLLTVARRISADALTPMPLTPALGAHQRATAAPDEPPGFLVGTAGADLAAAITTQTAWDACLLLS
ncbi:lanthionine synthetase C family protein [Streptomyces sp. NRRL F-5126]|uniref:lanthionine synthetase C family protein n=1 Tax=Streptomyces sp. NRRL F-5126 TaxID=1463857 RepID=UPI00068C00A1|nr:lanthionine synthetase C family protein [Streptomyces sp. NRRL F-5126]